ncbi:MAG TPA: ABC transporter ATP-binding protein [Actinobacteria bacterium]|nr:ABC transporter ATP-binding protein [Actinomycetota bacterium]HDL49134.1 ABC transporter ATP-binding protein [Actinomycetota bacterium]
MLVCEGLRKSFDGLVAVDDVSFQVAEGETYGLLGPNGAGKTTTISMIAGLIKADAGSVTVAGQPVTTRSVKARAAIGLVPQDVAVYPDLTARENIRFFGKLYGLTSARLAARADEVLEIIGLSERADDRVEEYSGGMKRRLNIGIGLLHEPRLLILDEPTVGVDPQSRNAILENVELLGREGMAVIYTTHYMEEAERLCDRVGVIDAGKLVAEGTRRELVGLIGSNDRIRVRASGNLDAAIERVRRIETVRDVGRVDDGIAVIVEDAGEVITEVLVVVTESGVTVATVEIDEPNLEDVFLHLTGKALRD